MKIIISKIKNKNLYYAHIDPKYYLGISTYGVYFKNNDKGFNCLLSFVSMIKYQYSLNDIEMSFSNELLSTYDNDILEQIDPPF